MSKSQEAYKQWINTNDPIDERGVFYEIWQAAWNARGKADAGICTKRGEYITASAIEELDHE